MLVVLDNDERLITFVSDRHAGLLNGVSNNFPYSPHGYCTRHLKENIKLHMGGKTALMKQLVIDKFDEVIYARTPERFQIKYREFVDTAGASVKDMMDKIEPEHYALAYFSGPHYDENTSNAAESLNKKFLEQRQLPVLGLVDGIRQKIMTDMSEKRDVSATWKYSICKVHDDALIDQIEVGKQWIVRKGNEFQYEVEAKRTVLVDLKKHECTCQSWQLLSFPCAHATRVFMALKLKLEDFVEEYYLTSNYRKIYEASIVPVPSFELNSALSLIDEEDIVLPPIVKAQPGRRKHTRCRSASEGSDARPRKQLRCSKCREFGHNARTCHEELE